MNSLRLHVLSLRYSSWSIRPCLALLAAQAEFEIDTHQLDDLGVPLAASGRALVDASAAQLSARREQGSVTGLFPVLYVNGVPIHESLAICEWVADTHPEASLWPADALERAQARAISCEMLSGFRNLRNEMSCHVFARVPDHVPKPETEVDIRRVFEIWSDCLAASGGPFLFGPFGIADCLYFPVLTRFRTYGVKLAPELDAYGRALDAHPAVEAWRKLALTAPRTPIYDDYIRGLGGDPDATAH